MGQGRMQFFNRTYSNILKLFFHFFLYRLFLFILIFQLSLLEVSEDREETLTQYLNQNNENNDVELMEAMKLLMMLNLIELYRKADRQQEIPTFAWLLFARDTSQIPEDFFLNHLDSVGRDRGLEQVGKGRVFNREYYLHILYIIID